MRTLLPVILACGILPSVTFAQEVEFSFGALIASDYISDGESLSGDKPVLQGYVELQYGRVYVGVWASTLDDGTDTAEADITIGYRQSIGDVDIDINYARTIYDKSGDCCGEFAIYAEYPLTDDATLGGGISFDTISDEPRSILRLPSTLRKHGRSAAASARISTRRRRMKTRFPGISG